MLSASKSGSASGASGYNLTRSLRTRSSASAYLNRTPASAGNQQKWTFSAWIKLGTFIADNQYVFCANSAAPWCGIYLNASNALTLSLDAGTANTTITTNALYRDPAAWYHVVVYLDTTQATAANRWAIYVNNVLQTVTTGSTPAQNSTWNINNTVIHTLSTRYSSGSAQPRDGYITEVNFIDGQALTPSSFGSTNALTGVWQPARYTGTYGTNGFYLPFTDNSALTTSSNVGLGKDFSGNGNYWTTNNISITAGVTYDSMTDVPTLTSATAANYCVLNPLMAAAPALVDGNLNTPSLNIQTVYGTISAKSGKWYWEGKCTARATGVTYVGVENNTYFLSNQAWTTSVFAMQSNSQKYLAGTSTAYGSGFAAGDTIGVALDVTNDTLEFFVNGTSQGQITSVGMAQNNMRPMFQGNTATWQCNFGQRPFTYTPPTGFVALNTYNLPTSTIVKGNTVMDATLYTGTLLSNAITNAASFKPDLVWLKSRSAATDHKLTDSVRGVTKALASNSTNAETTDTQGLTAFGSAGFTVGTDTNYNNLAATYVAWQWQAGQGSSSSNTNGTITSTVSVNAAAGFSVVTFATPGGYSTATVGHGLGVAPAMYIVKNTNGSPINWNTYHQSIGNTAALYLSGTQGSQVSSSFWNNTSPTSSVFSIGANLYASANHVAYCWTPIAGYSAFGSYTGNGSADGTFVYTGFRSKFVLLKRTDTTGNWQLLDTSRSTYNVSNANLYPNLANAEVNGGNEDLDILSNGFKPRNASASFNVNGATYIYACFAENPFKNALAR
jgi:hypothetical protein